MSDKITVEQIVKKYLTANGYDGLVQMDGECGCEIDDLAPCGEIGGGCIAGHKIQCPAKEGIETNNLYCEGECDWHIKEGKKK